MGRGTNFSMLERTEIRASIGGAGNIPMILCGALLTACEAGGVRQISESGFGAYEVGLAVTDRRAAVGWYDTRDGNAEIYVRLLDSSGNALGPDHRLTDTPAESFEVDLAALGEGFAVAWYERVSPAQSMAMLGYWVPDRGFVWQRPLTARSGSSRIPVVLTHEGRIFCAWLETLPDGAVRVLSGWWDAEGHRIGEPVDLAPASRTTWNLNAAIDPSGIPVVVYDAAIETEAAEVFLARADAEPSLHRLTHDDGFRSRYPDVAYSAGQAALTWFDERDGNNEVYLFVGAADALAAGIEATSLRVTRSGGDSIGAYLAWNDQRLGLAWSDDSSDSYEIYFGAFDAAGRPIGDVRRLTHSAADSRIPAIAARDGGFALAWNEVAVSGAGMHGSGGRSEVLFTTVR